VCCSVFAACDAVCGAACVAVSVAACNAVHVATCVADGKSGKKPICIYI